MKSAPSMRRLRAVVRTTIGVANVETRRDRLREELETSPRCLTLTMETPAPAGSRAMFPRGRRVRVQNVLRLLSVAWIPVVLGLTVANGNANDFPQSFDRMQRSIVTAVLLPERHASRRLCCKCDMRFAVVTAQQSAMRTRSNWTSHAHDGRYCSCAESDRILFP
jgi:hypothetical protein